MMLFNLHTHTRFSDGSDDPEKYIEEAIRQGFHTIGFTDHAPVPFENTFALREERMDEYCRAVRQPPHPVPLPGRGGAAGGGAAGGEVTILLGLEIDHIPGITRPFSYYRENFNLDYIIGSVHLVRNWNEEQLWFIDGPEHSIYDSGLREIFGGNIKKAVTAYYYQLFDMITTQKPDIIGHLDKIKMYNRNKYFREDESWYMGLVDEIIDVILDSGCVVEVNTRGIYKKRSDTLFPGPEILKKICKRGIPITLTSDAHKPHELSLYFPEAKALLKEIGFKNQWLRIPGGWKEVAFQAANS